MAVNSVHIRAGHRLVNRTGFIKRPGADASGAVFLRGVKPEGKSVLEVIPVEFIFAQKSLHELNCLSILVPGYNQIEQRTTLNGKGVDAVFWTNAVPG